MPKANLVLASGTTVVIEGTTEEVANLLERLGGESLGQKTSPKSPKPRADDGRKAASRSRKSGPIDHIRSLVGDNFFSAKRTLPEVQQKLEEQAHIYPVGSLSPALFRLVKSKELRRIKEDGSWKYVNP